MLTDTIIKLYFKNLSFERNQALYIWTGDIMKQKFEFEFVEKSGKLKISELAESDPGTFLPLHFEEYDLEEIGRAHV